MPSFWEPVGIVMGNLLFDVSFPFGWARWPRDFNDRAAKFTSMDDVTVFLGRLHCDRANGARLRELWRGCPVHACIDLASGALFSITEACVAQNPSRMAGSKANRGVRNCHEADIPFI